MNKNGFDAHEIKYEYLGKQAKVARYDLYEAKNGQIIIYDKAGTGEGIPTNYFIHKK